MIDFCLFGNSALVTVFEMVTTDHVAYVSYWNYIEKHDRTGQDRQYHYHHRWYMYQLLPNININFRQTPFQAWKKHHMVFVWQIIANTNTIKPSEL